MASGRRDSNCEREVANLLRACEYIGTANATLKTGDYAAVQGILRGVYNGLSQAVIDFKITGDRKDRIVALCELVADSRDKIMPALVKGEDVRRAVEISHLPERLVLLQETLRGYIRRWYDSAPVL